MSETREEAFSVSTASNKHCNLCCFYVLQELLTGKELKTSD